MVKMIDNPNMRHGHEKSRIERAQLEGVTAEQYVEYYSPVSVSDRLGCFIDLSHGVSLLSGWHHDISTGEPLERNVGEMIALMHSELSEALEADRKGLMDDKLPHRIGIEVELADLLHRVFDFAGKHKLDLGGAYYEKALYNARREDHKPENRLKEGGKAY